MAGKTTEGTDVGIGKKSGSGKLFWTVGGIILLALIVAAATQFTGPATPTADIKQPASSDAGPAGSGSSSPGGSGSVGPEVTGTPGKTNGTEISASTTPKTTGTPDKKSNVPIEYKRLPRGFSENDIRIEVYQAEANGKFDLNVSIKVNPQKRFTKISVEVYGGTPERVIAAFAIDETFYKRSFTYSADNRPTKALVYAN